MRARLSRETLSHRNNFPPPLSFARNPTVGAILSPCSPYQALKAMFKTTESGDPRPFILLNLLLPLTSLQSSPFHDKQHMFGTVEAQFLAQSGTDLYTD